MSSERLPSQSLVEHPAPRFRESKQDGRPLKRMLRCEEVSGGVARRRGSIGVGGSKKFPDGQDLSKIVNLSPPPKAKAKKAEPASAAILLQMD